MAFHHELYDALEAFARRGKPLTPQAALIDMDGVLYDSMPRHADAWLQMTNEIGLHCNRNEFFLYEGMTGRATIQLLMRKYLGRDATAEECERLYARKTALFAANAGRPLMPGATEMLKALGAFGLKRILVTGSGQASLIDSLTHDYPGVFGREAMVTAADVRHGKPDPEPYLMGLTKAGCEAWQAIVVENAPLGVEAGFRAGCFVCAVATGPMPQEALREAGADLVFASMPEFAAALPILIKTASLQALQ